MKLYKVTFVFDPAAVQPDLTDDWLTEFETFAEDSGAALSAVMGANVPSDQHKHVVSVSVAEVV
jgi:hypothetical protein